MNNAPKVNPWQFRIKDLILLSFIVAREVAGFGRGDIIYACLFITIVIIVFAVNNNLLLRVSLLLATVGVMAIAVAIAVVKDAIK